MRFPLRDLWGVAVWAAGLFGERWCGAIGDCAGREGRITAKNRCRARGACYNGFCAPVAQLDRASGYEPEGRMFESFRAHHNKIKHLTS